MICDAYAHLGTFQKQHKNQNIFESPHIFPPFLPKWDRLYIKALSQSYFISSRSDFNNLEIFQKYQVFLIRQGFQVRFGSDEINLFSLDFDKHITF